MEKWARFWGDSKRLVKPMGLAKSFGREVHIVLEADQIPIFQKVVKSHYRAYGRDLPWRNTEDPYKILVSEVMLQQTQVSRVIAKYESFLCAFPDIYSLAQAPLREVLNVWQGLGYNRRAVALQQAAQKVVKHFDQRIPSNVDSLVSLPGIGKATACAICTFAFNQPTLFIETNIRTAFIHYFFNCLTKVQDKHILPLVAQTLDHHNPREWYYALMDYGAAVKKMYGNPNTRSAHYQRQGQFKGSNRQIRGAIVKILVKKESISEHELLSYVQFSPKRVMQNLEKLQEEGIIVKDGACLFIP
ncbi:MAG: A/G-specific adenine glycosylase [Thermodesulfobacteriota bacterium]